MGVMTKNEITQEGYVNQNRQIALKEDSNFISNHDFAKSWKMYCLICDHIYGANSCDIHLRLCPNCQNGQPSLLRSEETSM